VASGDGLVQLRAEIRRIDGKAGAGSMIVLDPRSGPIVETP
jgi:hypothetical protein